MAGASFIKKLILVCIAAIFLNSCGAYFNTFYNTKKYYKQALDEHKKRTGDTPSSQEIRSFEKTVEQASKVLQFYPESKYVDDAIQIIGESFYYTEEYHKAERKFNELLENFPDSKYAPKAKLWLGKTWVQLGRYDEAQVQLQLIAQNNDYKSLWNDANYWLADCYYQQEKLKQAGETLAQSVDKIGDRELKRLALNRMGVIERSLKNHIQAAEYFRRAAEAAKDRDLKFQATLEYGRSLKLAGEYEKASRVFMNALDAFFSNREIGMAKLELANTLKLMGDQEKALEWYESITEDHPRTNASAGAFLELGIYQEDTKTNYVKAEELYQQAKQQNARSDYIEEIDQRLNDIQQLIKIEETINRLQKQITLIEEGDKDTASTAQSTEIEKGELDDQKVKLKDEKDKLEDRALKRVRPGAEPGQNKPEPATLTIEDVDSLKNEMVKQKIALAELFLLQYNEPDSAMALYLDILSGESNEEQRAVTFYAIAYIFNQNDQEHTLRDSIYQILADKYRITPQGKEAARKLGLNVDDNNMKPEMLKLRAAEQFIFEKEEPTTAIKMLEDFSAEYPETELNARALYALGYAYERKLDQKDKAYEIYKSLVEKYPESLYATNVKKVVTGTEKGREKIARGEDPFEIEAKKNVIIPTDEIYNEQGTLKRPPSRRKNSRWNL